MADPEAGWEQRFRADIRGSRDITDDPTPQKPKLQFHIPIRPQAARYRPGSGPPPPRVSLRPVHDSNAFIVDKVVLPQGPSPPNSSRARQRRCYYIIGWPDLPAARPVVDASRVLDYVSPRTLEDWEYQDALRREEERERAEEAERRALAKGKGVAGPLLQPGGATRRPGRPPKSRMMVDDGPPSEPELNSEQEELVHKRMRGPSLSTPQKSRLAQLQAEVAMLEELDAVDEDAVPAPPLGALGGGESASTSDRDVKGGVVEDLDGLRLGSAAPGISSGESSRASSARPAGPADRASAPATSAPSAARQKHPISTTPIPLPSVFSRMMNWRPKAKDTGEASTTTISQPKVAGAQGSAPTHSQSDPIRGQRSSPADLSSHTNGFTPIGGTFPRPPKRPADGSPHPDDASAAPKPGKSRRKKKRPDLPLVYPEAIAQPAGPPDPGLDLAQGEQEYVVKRLEGDQIIDGIHWFRVRWEGDWPEEENPTWEPRENIAERLVKQYLRRKAKGEADRHARARTKKKAKAKQQANPLVDQAKAYGSVLEVFEGQMNLDGPGDVDLDQGGAHHDEDVHAGGDGHDELFVIDQDRELVDIERRRAAQAEFATQLAGMARPAPRHF
ncbi:hypothetical protein KVR01_012864 [Diaporthe batatas]|uniref:uncharacterized protein n=1 Tax=Diaporthe batatas TaxID=748121 RepID=UPI001D052663|nr:uncharacterized protein KVR01_012864 [Diaporthe batatas]KAG8157156.1 hypothetical protein KVR01_012864 [Diaporthe batatas]